MKKVIFSLAAIAMAAGMFTGCSKKERNSGGQRVSFSMEIIYKRREKKKVIKII